MRVLSLLAPAFALIPLCASAKTPPPIVVSDCRGGIANVQLLEIAAYDVTFRNVSNLQADVVRLVVAHGPSKIATFEIRGTFLPNRDMRKALRKTVGRGTVAYESAQDTCKVQHVHFTNGKTWDIAQR